MFRISNTLVGVLNILTLLLGVAAVSGSLYIQVHGGANASDCQKVLQLPLLIGGVVVVVVSALGIAGSLCRLNPLLYAYLVVMFCLIVALVGFLVFAVLVTNQKVGKEMSGKGYREYRTYDFSNWLQKYVLNDENWGEIKSCLMDARVCQNIDVDGDGGDDDSLIYKQLTTAQNGCCKPPASCGFKMINATFWEAPKGGRALGNDSDCKIWNNREEKLCYECNSCKGGVLANIRMQWRRLAIMNGCALLLLIFIYVLGCCATHNNRSDHRRKNYHHHRIIAPNYRT